MGEKGVWVHNKHIPTEDFAVTLQEARNDILPPYGNRMYWNYGDSYKNAYKPTKYQGVILVTQENSNNANASTLFQKQTEGSIVDTGLFMDVAANSKPTGTYSNVNYLLEFAYH